MWDPIHPKKLKFNQRKKNEKKAVPVLFSQYTHFMFETTIPISIIIFTLNVASSSVLYALSSRA